jgi:adenylyltransferase/sulfurtransferase
MPLSNPEIARYSRHLTLPQFGMAGQEKLKAASVLLVGTGGLGSPAAMYLAAAGVGRLGIVDFDVVDESNLQRQLLHFQDDVGRPKVQSAKDKLRGINPLIEICVHEEALSDVNAVRIMSDYDVVVDGTDNFPTRFLVNDACVLLGKTNVYGSIFRFEGQASIFDARTGPCYRCIFPEPPPAGAVPSCAEGGVLGVLPGIIGSIQALEAIKWITGIGDNLQGRLLLFDALRMGFRELKVPKDPQCPICGDDPAITELSMIDYACDAGSTREDPQMKVITVTELKARIDNGDDFVLLDVREPHEIEICKLANSVKIPLGQLPERLGELDPAADIVVHCKMGVRSANACDFMAAHGFTKVANLVGGITAWSDEVDPSVPKY